MILFIILIECVKLFLSQKSAVNADLLSKCLASNQPTLKHQSLHPPERYVKCFLKNIIKDNFEKKKKSIKLLFHYVQVENAIVVELEDGLYAVNFVPYELGVHTVSVMYRDVDIPGSPFQFTVFFCLHFSITFFLLTIGHLL